ncbi:MAG: hypothetical protein IJL63_06640 [Clostridia bacterium]|nr:hypothetical protein [Clostridia bacterium]
MKLFKNRKALLAAAAVLLVIILLFAFVPRLRARLYTGDRIKGTVKLTVDGEEFPVMSEAVYTYEGENERKLSLDGQNFGIRGKGYGVYDLCFKIDNKALAEKTGDKRLLYLEPESELHFVYICTDNLNRAELELSAEIYLDGNVRKIKLVSDYGIFTPSGKDDIYSEAVEEYNYIYDNGYLGVDFGM